MIVLELVTPQNAMSYKAVRLQALQDTPSAFGSTYAKEAQYSDAEWIERASQLSGERATVYLALAAGAPCGLAGGYFDRDTASQANLFSMWVAGSHRRLNVGRRLVDAITAWADSRHASALYLMVTSDNEPAIAFYQSLGFSMTGRTEPYPNDPALIEYEMSRPLAGATAGSP
ncbi:MAG: GNAT family N-acetyltransferase [Candidatus Latescibacterota bacterium]|nr:GNAT family N-acetyltransferase [Candidatus Latescibacterota bacterium]